MSKKESNPQPPGARPEPPPAPPGILTDNTEVIRTLEARIAELVAQKTRSQEHYIKLLGKAEAENQRLRDALESIDESTHDVHAARKARKALLGGGG